MTSILAAIDSAVATGLENNASLKAFREQLRGGSANGQGDTVQSGLVPQYDEESDQYEIVGSRLPAVFIGVSQVAGLDTGAIEYSLVAVALLPHIVSGQELSDDDYEEFAQRMHTALVAEDPLNPLSVQNVLTTSVAAVTAPYRVEQTVMGGPRAQPRVEVQVVFQIPASTLLAEARGITEEV